MMNPKDSNNRKTEEVLELLSLTGQELALAEAYLIGEEGEEALESISFRDLSVIPAEKPLKLFRKKGRDGQAVFPFIFHRPVYLLPACAYGHDEWPAAAVTWGGI